MTLLIWLAATSLVWGGILWLAGRLLQRSPNVSGRARQWIWRGATALLVAPWIAAPLVIAFGLGLAPAETVAVQTLGPVVAGDNLAAMRAMDLANVETAVIANGGTIWAALSAVSLIEIVLLVVIAGWLVRFVSAQLALRNLLGIVMLSRKSAAGAAHQSVGRWSQRLKMRKSPQLRVVQEQHTPFSYGALRPTVCLPEGLEEKLSRQSLDLVVGHECVHVARGDGWLRPLERVTADVFWFNPFAWLIRRELDVARELAVDEAVIAMADSRMVYARTLREVAGISAGLPSGAPVAAMSLGDGRNLMLRVSRTLAQAKRRPARAAIIAASLLGIVGAPMAVAQVMLAVPAPPEPPHAVAPEPSMAPDVPTGRVTSKDGVIQASFGATVTSTGGSASEGYSVELLQTGANEQGDVCVARLDGLGSLSVARNDLLARGQEVGRAGRTGEMSFWVNCSDELDAQGRPRFGPPPSPPEPPGALEALEPLEDLAPLEDLEAPEAPQPPSAPQPVSRVAPVARVAPAAPAAPTPMAHPVPRVPATPATPAVAPAPPTLRTWHSPHPPAAPTAPVAPGQRSSLTLDGASHAVIVAPAKVTGSYGYRTDPFNQQRVFHEGVDLAAAAGTVVHAPVQGWVIYAGNLGPRGNTVKVQSKDGVVTTFGHLDDIKVTTGQTVAAGDVVGTVGSSGLSTGPHLHLEVSVNGGGHDPQKVTGLTLVSAQ
jgi:murein DD-endopeptidase MepM/ murein hydrolase activator NlpD/beta-lactamase regulating signal transducer with metallopeptidase domain